MKVPQVQSPKLAQEIVDEESAPYQNQKLLQTTMRMSNIRQTDTMAEETTEQAIREYNSKQTIIRGRTFNEVNHEELERYHAEWHWSVFIEFLIYHVIYYMIMGPFMVILFWKWPGIKLLSNMKFLIGNNRAFYVQTLLWIGSLVGGLLYFVVEGSLVTLTEIIFMWFAILLRCVVIAAKYATLSKARIRYYRNEILPDQIFQFDMMFTEWIEQSPKILFLEQYRGMRRHEFENLIYKFDFIAEPYPHTKDKILSTDICFYMEWSIKQPIEESCPQVSDKLFNGFHIFGYLVQNFQRINPQSQVMTQTLIIVILLSVTPAFIRIPDFLLDHPSSMDSLRFFVNIFTQFNAFFGSFIFLRIALYDFKRKFFLLDQCLYMLSVKQVEYSTSKKLLPTINFNNPRTLQAWSMLRSISFDYGQTFNLRTQGFFSLIFAGMMFFIVVSFAVVMDLIHLNFFELVLLSEMAIFITGFTIAYLYHGAAVNEYFDKFQTQLENLKSIYIDIQNLRKEYFTDNIKPINAVHRIFVSMLRSQVGDQAQVINKYIDDMVTQIDNNLRLVEQDRRNNPFKLYGVMVTYDVLKSAGVAICTLYSYAIQQRLMI